MVSKSDQYTKNVSETFIKLESPGDEVHGKLVAKSMQVMQSGDVGRYTVENEKGRFTFMGTVQIDHLLGDKRLGYDFKLVYKGTETTQGGREVKQFELYERA